MANATKRTIVLAMDASEHSDIAYECKYVIVFIFLMNVSMLATTLIFQRELNNNIYNIPLKEIMKK